MPALTPQEFDEINRKFKSNLLIGQLAYYASLACKNLAPGSLTFGYDEPLSIGATSLNGVEYIVEGRRGYSGAIFFRENHNLYYAHLCGGRLHAPDVAHCAFLHVGSASISAKWLANGQLHRLDGCAVLCALLGESSFAVRQFHVGGKHVSPEQFISLQEHRCLDQALGCPAGACAQIDQPNRI